MIYYIQGIVISLLLVFILVFYHSSEEYNVQYITNSIIIRNVCIFNMPNASALLAFTYLYTVVLFVDVKKQINTY